MTEYLSKLKTRFRIVLNKLRAINKKSPLITGEFQNVPREERLCNKCDSSVVSDENHAILECSNEITRQIRHSVV